MIETDNADGTYNVKKASLEQMYDKLNIYQEGYADLSNYETSEAIKEYLVADAKSSEWYKIIVDEVHAIPKFEISFERSGNGVLAQIEVEVAANETNLFANFKNHSFKFSYAKYIDVKTEYDINLKNSDIFFIINIQHDFGLEFSNTFVDFNSI